MAASSNTQESHSGGIGLLNLLGVLFVGLKLADQIDWSWWWVTLPLYLPVVIALALFVVAGMLLGVAKALGR